MGLGWNVSFENKTTGSITISKVLDKNWYPNDLEDEFKIAANQKAIKYTEIKSSGSSPLEVSKLILSVTSWGKEQQVKMEFKGTNGDLDSGFQQIVSGNGFEIGINGTTDWIKIESSKSDKLNVNITFS
ncbi:hypothetical protein [Microcoleus sp. B4-C1]|uniref:hypothetical protein n=1 Tax=Microcoleus sp. B4-C1 TaxID=2818660 RepID=UPI002FD408C8